MMFVLNTDLRPIQLSLEVWLYNLIEKTKLVIDLHLTKLSSYSTNCRKAVLGMEV